jgi:Ca-activated chloride channel family protein
MEPASADGNTHVHHGVNPWVDTSKDNLSTFAADVDTASYTLSRRTLVEGHLPPAAGVRVEEYVNFFRYSFPQPAQGSPFSVVMDAAPSPFEPGLYVLRVGVATPVRPRSQPANLVFLVDVSGSMSSPDKLGLAKRSLKLLVENLRNDDSVALVTYAGSTGVVLPATSIGEPDARTPARRSPARSTGSSRAARPRWAPASASRSARP